MDIGSAFTFMFDDEDWIKKLAIGGGALLLGIIIVPIFAVNGYMLQTVKDVRDGRPTPLPEWNELGTLITKGLIVSVIGLIYSIPALIFFCLTFGALAMTGNLESDTSGILIISSYILMCFGILLTLIPAILFPV
jgi:hypothetical protein